MRPYATAMLLVSLVTGSAHAQSPQTGAPAAEAPQGPPDQKPDAPYVHEETVVVTSSGHRRSSTTSST